MNRGGRTWLVFAACMGLGLAGLVWISRMVLGLEQREARSRSQAAQEERIRLALWRMDSALAPLVAQESSRPYFHFRARYPANAAYARMYDRPAAGAEMATSPLLLGGIPQVKLHFQVEPSGRFSSPQVPEGGSAAALPPEVLAESRNRLQELARGLSREHLLARIAPPREEAGRAAVPAAPPAAKVAAGPRLDAPAGPPPVVRQAEDKARELETKGQVEAARNVSEFAARARQQAASNEMALQQNLAPPVKLAEATQSKAAPGSAREGRPAASGLASSAGSLAPAAAPPKLAKAEADRLADRKADLGAVQPVRPAVPGEKEGSRPATVEVVATATPSAILSPGAVGGTVAGSVPLPGQAAARPMPVPSRGRRTGVIEETPFSPLWAGDHLLLARTVSTPEGQYLQGCWLDWEAIRANLGRAVADLLPAAQLLPAPAGQLDEPGRLLAALPVRLQPGPLPRPEREGLAPALLVLGVGWACALVSALAAGLLLHQALELGERRGAFVSAVTHELRTPLTTFRMYAELLHLGMVEDEAERRTLLETLVVESDRLDHLVKNVLSYARLESGRGGAALEPVPVTELLERGCERLSQRAAQAGMRVEIAVPDALEGRAARTDPSVVEQILFNLVDNACKYAGGGERLIHILAVAEGPLLALRVRDHGPGIARPDRRKLFRPFHKSAREAARSAPGVGLGLALCRRLAQSLGGELRLEEGAGPGACFRLELPLEPVPVRAGPAGGPG